MKQIIEFLLLGLLLALVYKKPPFLMNIYSNKLLIIILILLNALIVKMYGITSGIIMTLIVIILLDKKENFCSNKEGFVPKIQVWKPSSFSGPCQSDLDRQIKVNSEKANIEATKQLNEHTNDGFKVERCGCQALAIKKQLY